MKTTDFARLLTAFFGNYLPSVKNLSRNTILSYRDAFRLLLIFCRDSRKVFLQKNYLSNDSAQNWYMTSWTGFRMNETVPFLPETRGLLPSMPFFVMSRYGNQDKFTCASKYCRYSAKNARSRLYGILPQNKQKHYWQHLILLLTLGAGI